MTWKQSLRRLHHIHRSHRANESRKTELAHHYYRNLDPTTKFFWTLHVPIEPSEILRRLKPI